MATPSGINNLTTLMPLGNGRMYWSDETQGVIRSANPDGSGVVRIAEIPGRTPGCVIYDPVSRNIFWTEANTGANTDKIRSSGIDGGHATDVVFTDLDWCEWVEVDISRRKLYWSDRSLGFVQRSNIDGSNRETLISSTAGVAGVRVNPISGVFYLNNFVADVIRRINIGDLNSVNMVSAAGGALSSTVGNYLDWINDKYYWTDNVTQNIKRVTSSGIDQDFETLFGGVGDLRGIYVDSEGKTANGVSKIYVANYANGNITRYNMDGTNQEDLFTGGAKAFGIWLDIWRTNPTDLYIRGMDQVKTIPYNSQLYLSEIEGSRIRSSNLDGTGLQTLKASGTIRSPYAVAVDRYRQKIFWAEGDTGTNADIIYISEYPDFFDAQVLASGEMDWVYSIDPDKVNQKVYWADRANGNIGIVDYAGTNKQIIISGIGQPLSVRVDPKAGYIYYSNNITDNIYRASLSGTNQEIWVAKASGEIESPTSLFIDTIDRRLYWADNTQTVIKAANLDQPNSGIVQVLAQANNLRNIYVDAHGVATSRNPKIYYAVFDIGQVKRANIDGTNPEVIISGLNGPFELTIDLSPFVDPDLFVTGHETVTNDHILFISGVPNLTSQKLENFDLFISGALINTNNTDLFINGIDIISGSIPLSFYYPSFSNGDMTLHMFGPIETSGDLNLFVHGNTIASGSMSLCMIDPGISGIPFDDVNLYIKANLNPSDLFIVEQANSNILRSDFDGNGLRRILSSTSGIIQGLTVDSTNEKIYWVSSNKIYSANFDGSNYREVVTSGVSSSFLIGLDLDESTNSIYLADSDGHKILKVDIASSGMTNFIDLGSTSAPYGIFADVRNSHLYWSDTVSGCIFRANLSNGGSRIKAVDTGSGIRHIDADVDAEKMYWADQTSEEIRRADLNGSNNELLFNALDGVIDPIGIAVDKTRDYVYWSNNTSIFGSVQRGSFDQTVVENVADDLADPAAIALNNAPLTPSTIIDNDISLHTISIATASGSIDLFAKGNESLIDSCDLFVSGKDNASGVINLYTAGAFIQSSGIDLFIYGPIENSGSVPLFIPGPQQITNSCTLFIGKPQSIFSWAIENLVFANEYYPQLIGNLDYIGLSGDVFIQIWEIKFDVPYIVPLVNSGCYPIGNTGRWGFDTKLLPITDYDAPQYHYMMTAPNTNNFEGHFFIKRKRKMPKNNSTYVKRIT